MPAPLIAYEPPTCPPDTIWLAGREPVLAPGVRGYAYRVRGRIEIPAIRAEVPGRGDVGRFLDILSPNCVIVLVTNPALADMLDRRGWRRTTELLDEEELDVWIHPEAP